VKASNEPTVGFLFPSIIFVVVFSLYPIFETASSLRLGYEIAMASPQR